MATKTLTDMALKALKPKDKPYKISDGSVPGLIVGISTAGKKVFRLNFLFKKKSQVLTIGGYPELSLTDARKLAWGAKSKIKQGINPCAEKRANRAKAALEGQTFRMLADTWFAKMEPGWSDVHGKDVRQKLDSHILPHIGNKPMADIGKVEVKAILDNLDARGKRPTLKKCRTIISQVFNYALAHDIPGVTIDPTYFFRGKGIFTSHVPKHRAALTKPEDVKRLIKAIFAYKEISAQTCIALKFSALVFLRPGELRRGEWAEMELNDKIWRIPGPRMKNKKMHLVPLPTQALELLEELRPITCHSKYLFPSLRTADRPMSEVCVLVALRSMGFRADEMCAHGFRGTASTRLNEMGYNRDWIECQLAHSERDKVRAAYNHTDFLDDRRKMMQAWADYLWKLAGA